MNKTLKKTLVSFVVLLSVFTLTTGCGCQKNTTGTNSKNSKAKTNTNKDVVKDQEVDGLKLTNTSLTTNNGLSTLVTEVTNNTGKDYELTEFTITVKDGDGTVLATIPGYVGDSIPNGESRTINSSVDVDLSNAKSVEYSVKK